MANSTLNDFRHWKGPLESITSRLATDWQALASLASVVSASLPSICLQLSYCLLYNRWVPFNRPSKDLTFSVCWAQCRHRSHCIPRQRGPTRRERGLGSEATHWQRFGNNCNSNIIRLMAQCVVRRPAHCIWSLGNGICIEREIAMQDMRTQGMQCWPPLSLATNRESRVDELYTPLIEGKHPKKFLKICMCIACQ